MDRGMKGSGRLIAAMDKALKRVASWCMKGNGAKTNPFVGLTLQWHSFVL